MIQKNVPLAVGTKVYIVELKQYQFNEAIEMSFCDYSFRYKTVEITAISTFDPNEIQVLDGRTKRWMHRKDLYWCYKDILIEVYRRRKEHLNNLKSQIQEFENEEERRKYPLPDWVKVGLPIRYMYGNPSFDYTYDLIRNVDTRRYNSSEYLVEGCVKTFYIKFSDIAEDSTLKKHFEVLTPEHFKSADAFNVAMRLLKMLNVTESNEYDIRKIFNKYLLKDGKPDEE